MRKRIVLFTILVDLYFPTLGRGGDVSVRTRGDEAVLSWTGDEHIEVSIAKNSGLLHSPVEIKVDQRSVSFEGFYVEFNGEKDGYRATSTKTELDKNSVHVQQVLEHPRLLSPIRIGFTISMSPEDKAIRFLV